MSGNFNFLKDNEEFLYHLAYIVQKNIQFLLHYKKKLCNKQNAQDKVQIDARASLEVLTDSYCHIDSNVYYKFHNNPSVFPKRDIQLKIVLRKYS